MYVADWNATPAEEEAITEAKISGPEMLLGLFDTTLTRSKKDHALGMNCF